MRVTIFTSMSSTITATKPTTDDATASALRPAPIATSQMRRGCGERPRRKSKKRITERPLSARRNDSARHGVEHAVRRLAGHLRLGAKDESVAKSRREQRLDVVGCDELITLERRVGASRKHQEHLCPRAGA